MVLADFRVAFPEFRSASDALVGQQLAFAEAQIDPAVWKSTTAEGHGLLTAHKLALSPFGKQAKLSTASGSSTYLIAYDGLRAMVACAMNRVM